MTIQVRTFKMDDVEGSLCDGFVDMSKFADGVKWDGEDMERLRGRVRRLEDRCFCLGLWCISLGLGMLVLFGCVFYLIFKG